jgi:hypothetical protein
MKANFIDNQNVIKKSVSSRNSPKLSLFKQALIKANFIEKYQNIDKRLT